MLKDGKIKPGQSIYYEYFKQIYKLYEERISEKDFAQILGMTYESYRYIKSQRERKAKVLKESKSPISEEEKELIIEELLREGKIKSKQSIDYEEFKEIYITYKDRVSEIEFAEILGIKYAALTDIKNKRKKNKNS